MTLDLTMMITSAQNYNAHDSTTPHAKRKRNKSIVHATTKHRQDRRALAFKDELKNCSLSSSDGFPVIHCLSPTSSPSTSDSTAWSDSSGFRSSTSSTQTTDTEHGLCMIPDTSLSASSEKFSTHSHVTTTRREAAHKANLPVEFCERRQSLPSHDHSIQEITGILDPFISLPVDLPSDDRVLLQYYLSIGRRVILGTSEKPKHDLSLDMASRQMQHCPIHMLACINISEHIICVKNRLSHPPRLYQRIGRTYVLAKNILFQSNSSLEARVSALLNLQMMESALDQKATQAVHLQALDHLVSFEGGFPQLLSKMGNGTRMIEPVDLLGQCMWGIGFRKDQRLAFETAKNCLLDSLAIIRNWADKHDRSTTSTAVPTNRNRGLTEADDIGCLNPLKQYLRDGINSHLRRPKIGSLAHAPAMFNLLFSICFTLAWLDCPPRTTTKLLLELQKSMQTSVASDSVLPGSMGGNHTDNLHILHPNQVFSSFYHIRRGMTNSHAVISDQDLFQIDGESHLCSISIDVAKLFAVMSESIRVHLATELFYCTFYDIPDTRHSCFDRDELTHLDHELESLWTAIT